MPVSAAVVAAVELFAGLVVVAVALFAVLAAAAAPVALSPVVAVALFAVPAGLSAVPAAVAVLLFVVLVPAFGPLLRFSQVVRQGAKDWEPGSDDWRLLEARGDSLAPVVLGDLPADP